MLVFPLLILYWLTMTIASIRGSALQSVQVLSSSSSAIISDACTLGDTVLLSTSTGDIYTVSLDGGAAQSLLLRFNVRVNDGGLACNGSDTAIVCLYNCSCFLIANNGGGLQFSELYHSSFSYEALSTATAYYNSSAYVGMFRETNIGDSTNRYIYISEMNANRVKRYAQYDVTSSSFSTRGFVAGFEGGGNVYFAVEDPHPRHNDIRLLRICEESNASETEIQALYEIHLRSLPSTTLVDATLVNINNTQQHVPMVMITMASGSSSGVYGYRLSDIDSEMDSSFSTCIDDSRREVKMPWWEGKKDCDQFEQAGATHCDFNGMSSRIEALHKVSNIGKTVLLESDSRITASVFFTYHSVLLLFVATNSTISKYWVSNETHVVLLNTVTVEESVYHLDWSLQHNVLIASSNNLVFYVPLDDCSNYDSCYNCTQDILCGWCVVERQCSSLKNCYYGNLTGHWVQRDDQCPHIEAMASVSVDSSTEIHLFSNSTLPAPPDNRYYSCILENEMSNFSYTCPYINGSCQVDSLPAIDEKLLNINISLQLSNENSPFLSTTQPVLLVNCTKHINCTNCLSRDVCGWCVDDMACRGNSLHCTTNSSWYTATPFLPISDICPFLQGTGSYYEISVSAIGDMLLNGYNIPPSSTMNGRYTCFMLQASNTIQANGVYHNATSIKCSFTNVNHFSDYTDRVSVYVMWFSYQYSSHYKLEVINNNSSIIDSVSVLLYNCSVFSDSCTSCVERSLLAGIQCYWCNNGCFSNCIDNAVSTVSNCPQPYISSVHPLSSSVSGGTLISLHVNDLPINYNDILSVTIGSVECSLIESSFVSGISIGCETGPAPLSGFQDILLSVNRSGSPIIINSTVIQFLYEVSVVNAVVPTWGPIAGGTLVTVTGYYLNIGDTSMTYALVAGQNCTIMQLTENFMICRTDPVESELSGSVLIVVGGVTVSSNTTFHYRPNPTFTSLIPNKIIPAGGVTMSFYGNNMTSVFNPLLLIKHNNVTYTQYCIVYNNTLIQCQSPPISDLVSTSSEDLSYVLVLDSINITSDLTLRPNPVLNIVTKKSRIVTIRGQYIDSVLSSEIEVTIQEELCVIQEVTANFLTCIAPDITFTGSKLKVDVIFSVANYSVKVGQVEYSNATYESPFSLIIVIVIVSISFLTALMMLMVAVVAVKYWKVKNPPLMNLTRRVIPRAGARNRNKVFELSLQPSNHYCDVIERSTDGENIYDTINDNSVLYENQNMIPRTINERSAPSSLPLYPNTPPRNNLRPLSDVIHCSSSSQYTTSPLVAQSSLSSPDLTTQSLAHGVGSATSVTALLPPSVGKRNEGSMEDIDAEEGVFNDDESTGPHYSKINKKLTPIQEDSISTGGGIYSKLHEQERRPKFLTIPQEKYISMHSVAGPSPLSDSSSQPPPLPPPFHPSTTQSVSEYVQMVSAATTPQEPPLCAARPESSYVVMRSFSVSSETARSPNSQRKKDPQMQLQKKLSLSESEPDVFLTSSEYVDIQPN